VSECYDLGDARPARAVPMMVSELLGDNLALVDTGAGLEEISVARVDVEVGDVVLVRAKEAVGVADAGSPPLL
jgi:hydrogenase expression/formation protein HypC